MKVRTLVPTALAALLLTAGAAYADHGWHSSRCSPTDSDCLYRMHWTDYPDRDQWLNYDFVDETVSSHGVDWPVNFVFWNNAEIDKVKAGLNAWYPFSGSKMRARLRDYGGPYVWDEDAGRKHIKNPYNATTAHYRVYADPEPKGYDDRMYQTPLGFYVMGTSHLDHNEGGPCCKWHGYTERAEGLITTRAKQRWGDSAAVRNYASFYNREELRKEGNHIWSNNGEGTSVRVP